MNLIIIKALILIALLSILIIFLNAKIDL